MKVSKFFLAIIAAFLTTSCSTNSGHTPGALVVLAPIAKPANAISTALYNHKTKKVSTYLAANYDAVRNEAYKGNGEHLQKIIQLAEKDQRKMPRIKIKMQQEYENLFNNSKNIVMRLNLISAQSSSHKAPPMLPYSTRMELLNEVSKDYESFRLSIKNREKGKIARIVEIFSIPESNQATFYNQLFDQYKPMFIDSVTQRIFYILNTVH